MWKICKMRLDDLTLYYRVYYYTRPLAHETIP